MVPGNSLPPQPPRVEQNIAQPLECSWGPTFTLCYSAFHKWANERINIWWKNAFSLFLLTSFALHRWFPKSFFVLKKAKHRGIHAKTTLIESSDFLLTVLYAWEQINCQNCLWEMKWCWPGSFWLPWLAWTERNSSQPPVKTLAWDKG